MMGVSAVVQQSFKLFKLFKINVFQHQYNCGFVRIEIVALQV